MGEAVGRDGAAIAVGIAACAQGRAEVHDRLGVGGCVPVRRVLLSDVPQLLRNRGFTRPAFDCPVTCEHAFHITVEDRMPLIECETQYRPGR